MISMHKLSKIIACANQYGSQRMRGLFMVLVLGVTLNCFSAERDMMLELLSNPAAHLPAEEKGAWAVFFAGVTALQKDGDRKHAAELFKEVGDKYPKSRYAKDSIELGVLLGKMLEEDERWAEVPRPDALPFDQRVAYFLYHLRDVECYQYSDPGMCVMLGEFGRKPGETNAAMKLKELGAPVIPTLIALLEDRRPTRSVGWARSFYPARTVLRYQDAAIEILNEILPTPFYERSTTAAYFSNEKPEVRERVIRAIKLLRGKTELERKSFAP